MFKDGLNITATGVKVWYKNGKPHRDDGPAVMYDSGSYFWYKEGKLHRDDGPSIFNSATKEQTWYINGEKLGSMQAYLFMMNLPREEEILIKLKYSK